MNILIKIGKLSGGAPLSALQYAKVLKKLSHNVIVEGTKHNRSISDMYIKEDIQLNYNCEDLDILIKNRRFFRILKYNIKEYNNIKNKHYDMIITIGGGNLLYFVSVISYLLSVKFVGVIAGGDARIVRLSKLWKSDNVICFSNENKEDIQNTGFKGQKIHVISNRISSSDDKYYRNHYEKLKDSKMVNFLLTSRLEESKIGSIKNTILLIKWLNENGIETNLRIAGDGEKIDEIINMSQVINNEFGEQIIVVLGHIDCLNEEFFNAHFVVGKGRSVIEPIMMKRIGIVASENGEFSVCNQENIENLYNYNFSGRYFLNPTSKEQIRDLILSIQKGEYEFNHIIKVSQNLRLKYDVFYLKDKLQYIINTINIKSTNELSWKYKLPELYLILATIVYFIKQSITRIKYK